MKWAGAISNAPTSGMATMRARVSNHVSGNKSPARTYVARKISMNGVFTRFLGKGVRCIAELIVPVLQIQAGVRQPTRIVPNTMA